MRPAVKRRLVTLAAAASLLLCVATVALSLSICLTATALLIRSFWVSDIVGASVTQTRKDFYGVRQFLLQSHRGYLAVVDETESAAGQPWHPRSTSSRAGATRGRSQLACGANNTMHRTVGCHYVGSRSAS
jgi:hypothetical protein